MRYLLFILIPSLIYSLNVQVVEVPSEIGAGTRGACLGAKAVEVAAMNAESDYFKVHPVSVVRDQNFALLEKDTHPHAKRIDSMYRIYSDIIDHINPIAVKPDNFIVVLAGDHSTAAGTIAALKKAHPQKRLGVIWIDAHADIHSPYTSPSGNMHGMPVAAALAKDHREYQINNPGRETVAEWNKMKYLGYPGAKIKPQDLVYMAVRDIEPEEEKILKKYKIRNYKVDEIRKLGAKKAALEALNRLHECDMIYVSFDVDSMDSDISMGTGTPVREGITEQEAKEILTQLVRSPKCKCLEFAEINPTLDEKNKMADISFDLLQTITDEVTHGRTGRTPTTRTH